jgi:hypothetical protein
MARNRERPHYSLDDIKKMAMGGCLIERGAFSRAWTDFNWEEADIIAAVCGLRKKHFWKSAPHHHLNGEIVDVYHARRLKGFDVYIHFHVLFDGSEQKLIIGSCKKLEV